MGTYLSTPVTTKRHDSGSFSSNNDTVMTVMIGTNVVWGVVDMQGWRKTMEDSHVSQTNVELEPQHHHHVFGVFDGHGGAEVARFCSLYFCTMLSNSYRTNGNSSGSATTTDAAEHVSPDTKLLRSAERLGSSLVHTFHGLDTLINTRHDEVLALRGHPGPEFSEQRQLAAKQFSAIVGDDESTATTPLSTAATDVVKEEEKSLALTKKQDSEASSPNIVAVGTEETTDVATKSDEDAATATKSDKDGRVSNDDKNVVDTTATPTTDDNDDTDSVEPTGKQEASQIDQDLSSSDEENDDYKKKQRTDAAATTITSTVADAGAVATDVATIETTSTASQLPPPSASVPPPAIKINTLLKRLMNLKETAGTMVMNVTGGSTSGNISDTASGGVASPSNAAARKQKGPTQDGCDASVPSIVRNGQLVCNLPDHPIHAGATAVVAVIDIATSQLIVANAGDSRGVLARNIRAGARGNDTAYALSYDHKPTNDIEHTRIRNAGGFVNAFGRINGNLNLSRSIGDLKYKQVPDIVPAKQMITAQPDVTVYVVHCCFFECCTVFFTHSLFLLLLASLLTVV